MAEKIFVSYVHQDRDMVKAVMRTLRKHGIVTAEDAVILDAHDVEPGENVRRAIKEQISSASKVVIIASADSAKSELVNYEAGMAAALEKPIFVMGKKGSGKAAPLISALGNVQSLEIGGEA